ncbi:MULTISPECIES: FAD-dependent L-amino acid oxidase [Pseudoalteromonas]|uniref:Tryptophan 2-monooxygenase n=1 Tax=Pseudoalteromonas obscura TaxID=3048491 RepID=A0ABT7EHQ2_9GAMM|nr:MULTISPECIES: FAD-dependent L-amino acid oxidase [Pseudoalteromonas]MBQ4836230.1 FAD-dependent L-amino acid oxidase [Pseudoalteromonas luteoviolacea]MDK2594580.1 FAD-dependent L-amino acid oxidase [Pseudoalteromonas sp. P94(2023)]
MTHFTFGKEITDKPLPSKVKVAIVGAGMSGLYSAWRLQQEAQCQDLAIFERSNRTGGRLDSDLIKFNNLRSNEPKTITVKEEQGGMRFLFDGMDDLMALFLKLNLQNDIVPFPMNSGGNNRLFFRGESFSVSDAQQDNYAIWSHLYNLDQSEQGVNPKDIVNVVFNRILEANPQFQQRPEVRGPEFWQAFRLECQWQGQSLNEWTLWDLYTDMGYSQECINMLYRVLGFNGTFLSQMNAGVAYQLLEDFPANVQFKTFKDGFSTLPNTLVEEVGTDNIHLQTNIDEIDYAEESGLYTLHYTHKDEHGRIHQGAVQAEKVILGLPRLALEKLFVRSNAFNQLDKARSEQLWNTLQTASNQPLLKINLYYDSAWWGRGTTGRPAVEFGPNFADLPTGSVYPFYAVNDELAAALMYQERTTTPSKDIEAKLDRIGNDKYERPAALTIYCDYLNINFWSNLQNIGETYHHPDQAHYIQEVPDDIYPASTAVVAQATKFFKEIFNTHYVPAPILTSARIWEGSTKFDIPASRQFGYGVHQWAVGANDKEVMATLSEPLPNLYTCGEAFSDYQGWVEGALRSTDLALEKGFGLKPFSQVYFEATNIHASDAIKAIYEENSSKLINQYIESNFSASAAPIDRNQNFESVIGVDLSYFDTK